MAARSTGLGRRTAIRSYTHVFDLVDGIYRLMHSDLEGPANIGHPEYVTVKQLVDTSSPRFPANGSTTERVKGPVGVQSRNFSNEAHLLPRLAPAQVPDQAGHPRRTYPWIR